MTQVSQTGHNTGLPVDYGVVTTFEIIVSIRLGIVAVCNLLGFRSWHRVP